MNIFVFYCPHKICKFVCFLMFLKGFIHLMYSLKNKWFRPIIFLWLWYRVYGCLSSIKNTKIWQSFFSFTQLDFCFISNQKVKPVFWVNYIIPKKCFKICFYYVFYSNSRINVFTVIIKKIKEFATRSVTSRVVAL